MRKPWYLHLVSASTESISNNSSWPLHQIHAQCGSRAILGCSNNIKVTTPIYVHKRLPRSGVLGIVPHNKSYLSSNFWTRTCWVSFTLVKPSLFQKTSILLPTYSFISSHIHKKALWKFTLIWSTSIFSSHVNKSSTQDNFNANLPSLYRKYKDGAPLDLI